VPPPPAPRTYDAPVPAEPPSGEPGATATASSAAAPEPGSQEPRAAEAQQAREAPAAATDAGAYGGTREALRIDPHDWAARVAALYEAGAYAAAERELRAFRAAIPEADTYLDEALRGWAQAVD
jgi:hypothetical protein